MRWPRPGKKTLAKIFLLAASFVVAGALGEVMLRLVAPQDPSWFDIYRRHPSLPMYALMPNVRTTVDTGESRWTIETDAAGDRTAPGGAGGRDGPTVLLLGDSFLFGTGVNYEDSLAGDLARRDPGHTYLNEAVPGYGPTQYRLLLDRALAGPRPPRRVVVVTFLGNDFFDCIWDKDVPVRAGVIGDRGDAASLLKRHSHLYRLLSKAAHRLGLGRSGGYAGGLRLYEEDGWRQERLARAERIYREEFRRMAESCGRRGIPLCVGLIPESAAVEAAARGAGGPKDFQLPTRRARTIFDDLEIPYVDLTPALARLGKARAYFAIDGHLTPAGHQVAAEAIREGCLGPIPPPRQGASPSRASR